jgi:hypothetical protein
VRRASSEEGRSGAAAGRKRDRRTTTWIRDPEEFLDQSQDSRMILSEFRRLYRGLSASGRVVLGLAVVGTVALVTIIGALLASGMR